MSIILKGIDLPTDGKTLIVGIYGNGLVSMEYTKPLALAIEINAEAIQIPKGHGRLIDADALETVFKDMAECEWNQKVSPISWAYAFEDTIDEIDNAPTILEAEGEDVHKSNV